jgi:hypothetical protein
MLGHHVPAPGGANHYLEKACNHPHASLGCRQRETGKHHGLYGVCQKGEALSMGPAAFPEQMPSWSASATQSFCNDRANTRPGHLLT